MFTNFINSKHTARKRIFLGSPEAEAESADNSAIPLNKVYEDYHGIAQALSAEKFIVLGRKGSGKSAFATFFHNLSKNNATLHCRIIKKSDVNLEKIIQLGKSVDANVDSESFFKWIIYTNFLELFSKISTINNSREYDDLRKFLEKNRGYIAVTEFEIKDLVTKHGFSVSIEYFKRFLTSKINKKIEFKSERAPYYKLIPHLEDLIKKVLSSQDCKSNENFFSLFFDDLDVDFDLNEENNITNLMALIRSCRHINNTIFRDNDIDARVILFIRDDVANNLINAKLADSAKIFTSYSARIDWYDEKYSGRKEDENELALKKFINQRIAYFFESAGLEYNKEDPWSSFALPCPDYTSSFKYIVNQTLFRPRDLLLYFLPLQNSMHHLPIDFNKIKNLSKSYASELGKEIRNELSAKYSIHEVESLLKVLGRMSSQPQSQKFVLDNISELLPQRVAQEVLNELFTLSLIGVVKNQSMYFFKCRETEEKKSNLMIEEKDELVVQYGMQTYLHSNKIK